MASRIGRHSSVLITQTLQQGKSFAATFFFLEAFGRFQTCANGLGGN